MKVFLPLFFFLEWQSHGQMSNWLDSVLFESNGDCHFFFLLPAVEPCIHCVRHFFVFQVQPRTTWKYLVQLTVLLIIAFV